MAQEDNILEMETLGKWNGNFRLGTEKVGYLRRSSVCSGKFPFNTREAFAY